MVWTRPVVRLAKELGYTYLELAAICADLNIPRPSGGYWYRQSHGSVENPTPLPPATPGKPTYIPFGPKSGQATAPAGESNPGAEAVKVEAVPVVPRQREEQTTAYDVEKAVVDTPPSCEPIRITREELYDKVWKTTLKRLVNELSTTRLELLRACEELKVPRPDQGYWTRIQLGLPAAVTPLPVAKANMAIECLLQRHGAAKAKRESPNVPAVAVQTGEPHVSNQLEVHPAEPQISSRKELPTKVEFTREELYKAMWSKSCVKLAAELGISDVALAKTCRRMGIPKPPRGYWARIEAGEKLKCDPLSAAKPGQGGTVTFDVSANVARREEYGASHILTTARIVKCGRVELAPEGCEFHPIAEKHRQALLKAKPGELGFVSIHGKDVFDCSLSAAMVPRLLQALHAIVCELEDRDYEIKPGSNHRGLRITRDNDEATLSWSEARLEVEREPSQADKRKPSWTWQLKETKPAGKLSVEIGALGMKGKRRWTEGEGRSLEEVLGVVVEKVETVFRGYEDRREREAAWAKEREAEAKREAEQQAIDAAKRAKEEKLQNERERIKRHAAKLEEIAGERRENLATAAQDWMEAQGVFIFVDACEEQWRREGGGILSKDQADWLSWARSEAGKMGPFAKGYPSPSLDGAFEASAVPVGGPYPETRKWERRKTKEKSPPDIKPPVKMLRCPQ
jgi:hypothetical protein